MSARMFDADILSGGYPGARKQAALGQLAEGDRFRTLLTLRDGVVLKTAGWDHGNVYCRLSSLDDGGPDEEKSLAADVVVERVS